MIPVQEVVYKCELCRASVECGPVTSDRAYHIRDIRVQQHKRCSDPVKLLRKLSTDARKAVVTAHHSGEDAILIEMKKGYQMGLFRAYLAVRLKKGIDRIKADLITMKRQLETDDLTNIQMARIRGKVVAAKEAMELLSKQKP